MPHAAWACSVAVILSRSIGSVIVWPHCWHVMTSWSMDTRQWQWPQLTGLVSTLTGPPTSVPLVVGRVDGGRVPRASLSTGSSRRAKGRPDARPSCTSADAFRAAPTVARLAARTQRGVPAQGVAHPRALEPIRVRARIVWRTDGECWLDAIATRWTTTAVQVEFHDHRLGPLATWVTVADVRQRS